MRVGTGSGSVEAPPGTGVSDGAPVEGAAEPAGDAPVDAVGVGVTVDPQAASDRAPSKAKAAARRDGTRRWRIGDIVAREAGTPAAGATRVPRTVTGLPKVRRPGRRSSRDAVAGTFQQAPRPTGTGCGQATASAAAGRIQRMSTATAATRRARRVTSTATWRWGWSVGSAITRIRRMI